MLRNFTNLHFCFDLLTLSLFLFLRSCHLQFFKTVCFVFLHLLFYAVCVFAKLFMNILCVIMRLCSRLCLINICYKWANSRWCHLLYIFTKKFHYIPRWEYRSKSTIIMRLCKIWIIVCIWRPRWCFMNFMRMIRWSVHVYNFLL